MGIRLLPECAGGERRVRRTTPLADLAQIDSYSEESMFSAPGSGGGSIGAARFPFPTGKRCVLSLLPSRVNGQSQ